jgi:histone-lysine N-methyltransferase SETMAR
VTNVQDDQAPAKRQKMLKKFENISTKTVAEQSISLQTLLGWISYGVCQEILIENLNIRHIAAKFVPHLLTNDQKQRHVNLCLEVQEKANKDPTFISRIITRDESWIYGYDPETKQQSFLWKSPQSLKAKKAWQVRSSTKSMLIVFLDVKGIVHREFVPPKMTANSDFYRDVLKHLRENV